MTPSLRILRGETLAAGTFAAAFFLPAQLSDGPVPEKTTGPVADPPAQPVHRPSEREAWYRRVEGHLEARAAHFSQGERKRLAAAIVEEALVANLDPALVLAIIEIESDYDPHSKGSAGASGLMQVIPETLSETLQGEGELSEGVRADQVMNVQAGVRYYRRLLSMFKSPELALMAYNAGPQRISGYLKTGRFPPRFRGYPRRVLAETARLHRVFAIVPAPMVAERSSPGAAH